MLFYGVIPPCHLSNHTFRRNELPASVLSVRLMIKHYDISKFVLSLGQMQNEQGRLTGQQAELQRRLGEAELRAELNCKAAEQEANSVRTEAEFLRRKIDLLSKEAESRKQDYDKAVKELEQRNLEVDKRIVRVQKTRHVIT